MTQSMSNKNDVIALKVSCIVELMQLQLLSDVDEFDLISAPKQLLVKVTVLLLLLNLIGQNKNLLVISKGSSQPLQVRYH